MAETRVPALPSVDPDNLVPLAKAVKQLLDVREGRAGDPLDSNVTFRDLVESGLAQSASRFPVPRANLPVVPVGSEPDGYNPEADFVPPPRPENFTATGLFASVQLQWDAWTYRNHSYTEIWRSETNVIGNAVLIGTSDSRFYVDQLGNNATRYYWARFVSKADVEGPYHSVSGAVGQTATNPALVLASLSGQIRESHLFSTLASRINLIDAPAATPGSVNERLSVVQAQVNDLLNTPTYSGSETYLTNELVTYNGSIYRAKQTTTGNLPTNTTYWEKVGEYSSLGAAVAAHTNQITTLTTDLSAEVSARQTLASQVNNPTTGLPATRATLLNDYYTKTAADSAISSAISTLSSSVNNTLTGYVTNSNLTTNYYTKSATDSAISQATTSLNTSITNTLTGYVTNANLTTNYYTRAATDSAISAATSSLVSTTALNTALSSYVTSSTLTTNHYTKTQTDSAISAATSTLVSTTALNTALAAYTNTATLQTNYYTKTQTDSAISSATTTLQSTINNTLTGYATTASLQAESTTRANADGTLFAQYTVKTDVNGYVSGFGLANTANNATPTSSFIVRADNFSIANPSGPSIAPAMPFIVRTTTTTINGVSVPVGVYIAEGFIQNGTITNAKIGNAAVDNAKIANLDAAKITSGFISADRIQAGSLDAKIANIDAARITTGTIDIARIGTITAANINGAGLTVTSGQYTGYAWPSSGTGFYLGQFGFLLGRYDANDPTKTYFQFDLATGALYANGFSIVNGAATFGGNLSAAGGTFSGNLTAAGGTFSGALTAQAVNAVNTINIAGNAVSVFGLSTRTNLSNNTESVVSEDFPIFFSQSGTCNVVAVVIPYGGFFSNSFTYTQLVGGLDYQNSGNAVGAPKVLTGTFNVTANQITTFRVNIQMVTIAFNPQGQRGYTVFLQTFTRFR